MAFSFLRLFFIFILLFTSILTLQSQDLSFKVLIASGEIYKKSSDSTWQRIIIGNKLNQNDLIKLSNDKSYLVLLNAKNYSHEIFQMGEYTVKQLTQKVNQRNQASISSKFFDYLSQELFSGRELAKDVYLGAVERRSTPKIKVFLPRTTKAFREKLDFIWYSSPKTSEYKINIYDTYSRLLFEKTLVDTFFTIDLTSLNISTLSTIFWNICSTSDPDISSDEFIIELLSNEASNEITDSLRILEQTFDNKQSAFYHFTLAFFFANYELNNIALKYFNEAVYLAQDVVEYKKFYSLFLRKIGLNEEAKKLW